MSQLLLRDSGAMKILDKFFKTDITFTIRLFTDNLVMNETDQVLTEATGGGYAAIPMVTANFVLASSGGIAQITYPQVAFTFTGALTGAGTIHGMTITRDGDNSIIYAGNLAVPFTPTNAGDTLVINPLFQLGNGTII